MATQYTSILKLALPVQGELSGTWGDVVNDNITSMVEEAIAGRAVINTWTTNSHTLTTANGTTSESRCAMLEFTDTGAALTGAGEVICPAQTKIYIAKNASGQIITVKTAAGTGIAVQNGETKFVFCDGTNVVEAVTSMTTLKVGTGVQVSTILDEDNMASDSATALATQQSIKAYVDSQVTAQDLDFAGDTGTGAVDLDSQSLTVAGTANEIETSASGQTLTVGLPSAIIVTTSVTTPTVQTTNLNANDGTAAATIADATGVVTVNSAVLTTADINAGTIDNTTIGGTTAAAGSFTTVDASGNITSQGQVITNTINEQTATSGVTVDGVLLKDGGATFTADAVFGDNDKAIFGAGSDLQIYHDGDNSFIQDVGVGSLILRATNFRLFNSDQTKVSILANDGSNTSLYYDGSPKLATTATGVDVTGQLVADSGQFDGNVNIDGTVTADGLTVDGSTRINDSEFFIADNGTSTTAKLSFDIDATNGARIRTTVNGATSIQPLGIYTGSTLRQKYETNGDISFYEDTGTTPKFFWDASTERLGIGNAAPATALDVTGTITADGLTVESGTSGITVDTSVSLSPEIKPSQALSDLIVSGTGNGGHLKFKTDDTDRVKIDGGTGDISFYEDTGTTPKFFWDASAESLGIGTTSTGGAKLAIVGSAANNGWMSVGHSTVNLLLGHGAAMSSDSTIPYVRSNQSLGFATGGGAERLRIDASGNVGIGTSSPTQKLHVVVTGAATGLSEVARFERLTTGDNAYLRILADNTNNLVQYDSSGSQSGSHVFLSGNTERMRIDSSGNVGIGTSSPAHEFHVYGSTTVARLEGSSTGVYLNFKDIGGDTVYVGAVGNNAYFETNGAERMRIDSSGNVGIGVTPSSWGSGNFVGLQLGKGGSIAGRGSVGTEDQVYVTANAHYDGTEWKYIANNYATNYYQDNSTHVWRYAASGTAGNTITWSEAMRIDSSGNLLVGTTDTDPSNDTTGTGGIALGAASYISLGRANATPLLVNRIGTDGENIIIKKDGATVGSIGVQGSKTYIGTGDAGLLFDNTNNRIDPCWPTNTGSTTNGTLDLGGAATRFKDLYLSNAVRLGNAVLQEVNSTDPFLSGNAYWDGSNWKYIQDGDATNYYQADKQHIWRYAVTGTAGNNITWNEAARINASGHLLVGTTDAGIYDDATDQAGHNLLANGQYYNSAVSEINMILNKQNSDGDIVQFRKDGTTVGSIGSATIAGGTNLIIDAPNAVYFGINIRPETDDSYDVGSLSLRWDDIYATNALIQTSDRNEKQDIAELTEAERRVAVAAKGLLRKFRWKSAVEEKGDDARIHFGIIAQDLQAAFEAEGLDAGRYAMFIHSTWTDEETGEERSRMGVRYSELLAFIIAAI